MRVLHITNLYPSNKFPTYGIFVKEQIESLSTSLSQDVVFINAKENGLLAYIKVIKGLKKKCDEFDIIHCHHQFSVLPLIFVIFNKKIVLSLLGDLSKRNILNRFIFKLVEYKCDKIVIKNSTSLKNSKYFFLPNGVNTEFFKPFTTSISRKLLGLEEHIIYVLFVCNGDLTNPIKRKDLFDNVIDELNKSDSQNEYVELVLSNIQRENTIHFYNAANFMLVTSDHEGSPNAVKEAMACNLPIVSTPVGDVKNNLKFVSNSFVTNSHNVDELISAAKKLNLNERSNARDKIFRMNLDVKSKAEELINLYSHLK